MSFFTKIKLDKYRHKINYDYKILTIGSCFSENIGKLLKDVKHHIDVNPFGVIYNAYSLQKLIKMLTPTTSLDGGLFGQNHENKHFHYDFPSIMNGSSKVEVNENIQNRLSLKANKYDWIIITLGTSYAYRLLENDTIVANCHKMPQKLFSKELLPVDAQYNLLSEAINIYRAYSPNAKFILTVSPVRHIKDGIVENSRSKSRLIETAQLLSEELVDVSYFPAYEIMMDELRDYRFYTKDMIHPSEVAIEHIYKYFLDTYFTPESITIQNEITSYNTLTSHRPLDTNSANQHLHLVKAKYAILKEKYPQLQWD